MQDSYKLVSVPNFIDDRGGLAVIQSDDQILDFKVERVYWLYNFKKNRGGHAHKNLKQLMICTHGYVEIVLDDGKNRENVLLDSPDKALYVIKPLWRELVNFKNNPQVTVLASDIYKPEDYIRSYDEFKLWKLSF